MALHKITQFFSNEGTRNDVRMRVVNVLSTEDPGTGTSDNASKYTYYVETLSSGDRVYLQRPANLHNGFDFLVCVENANYAEPGKRRRNFPKHDDFGVDLQTKKLQFLKCTGNCMLYLNEYTNAMMYRMRKWLPSILIVDIL